METVRTRFAPSPTGFMHIGNLRTCLYAYLWAKVIDKRTRLVQDSPWIQKEDLGFFVDIFVLDGAGKTLKEAEATYEKAFDIFKQYRRSVKNFFLFIAL